MPVDVEMRDRLRKSLTEVCGAISQDCIMIRSYPYDDGSVDAEIRIQAPSRPLLRRFLVELEEKFQEIQWPKNAWFSVMAMGNFEPSREEGDKYAKRLGMSIIEMYPVQKKRRIKVKTRKGFQYVNGMAAMFLRARDIVSALYKRQKTLQVAVRVFVGKHKPDRRFQK